jgi:hypothetical protein
MLVFNKKNLKKIKGQSCILKTVLLSETTLFTKLKRLCLLNRRTGGVDRFMFSSLLPPMWQVYYVVVPLHISCLVL